MNKFREICSINKTNRFRKGDYNLDLTYITSWIIAMALPGEGFKSLYKNHIETVADFFEEYHKDHFMIINSSSMDYSKYHF